MQAAFTVDVMNEADLLERMSCKVPVGKSSMRAKRECPADETDLAWAAVKVFLRCLAGTFTGTVMKAQSNGSGSCWKGHSGMQGARTEDIARPRSLAWRSMVAFVLRDLFQVAPAFASARSATCSLR